MQFSLLLQMGLWRTAYHCGRQLSARRVAIARARLQTGAQIGALGGDALLRVTQLISGLNTTNGIFNGKKGRFNTLANHIKWQIFQPRYRNSELSTNMTA